jgi:hypothetical protein
MINNILSPFLPNNRKICTSTDQNQNQNQIADVVVVGSGKKKSRFIMGPVKICLPGKEKACTETQRERERERKREREFCNLI